MTTIDYSKWENLDAGSEEEDDSNYFPSERDIVAQDAKTIDECRKEAKEVGFNRPYVLNFSLPLTRCRLCCYRRLWPGS